MYVLDIHGTDFLLLPEMFPKKLVAAEEHPPLLIQILILPFCLFKSLSLEELLLLPSGLPFLLGSLLFFPYISFHKLLSFLFFSWPNHLSVLYFVHSTNCSTLLLYKFPCQILHLIFHCCHPLILAFSMSYSDNLFLQHIIMIACPFHIQVSDSYNSIDREILCFIKYVFPWIHSSNFIRFQMFPWHSFLSNVSHFSSSDLQCFPNTVPKYLLLLPPFSFIPKLPHTFLLMANSPYNQPPLLNFSSIHF